MEPSASLATTMEGFYRALSGGDLAFLDDHISVDAEVRGIGTDPDEWWSGGRLLEVWKEQVEAMGGSMPLSAAGELEAYEEGEIGWVADRPKLSTPDGDVPLRFTAVFRREGGVWRMIQSHGSIGVGNEDSFGERIPT